MALSGWTSFTLICCVLVVSTASTSHNIPSYIQEIDKFEEFYAIDTMQLCSNVATQKPASICEVSTLLSRLRKAKVQLKKVISENSSIRKKCRTPVHSKVIRGLSLEQTLYKFHELLTHLTLNLTIIDNHPCSVSSRDVSSYVAEALCVTKSLLSYAPSHRDVTVSFSLTLKKQYLEDYVGFTCTSLKSAKRILQQMITHIEMSQKDLNDPLPTYSRII